MRKQTRKAQKKPRKSALTPANGKVAPVPDNRQETGTSTGFGAVTPPEVGTAKQFKPGESGNPGGRPKSRGLLNVLRAAVGEDYHGRTIERALVEVLIQEALESRNRLPAIQTVFDRLEGRPKQQLDLNDITAAMANRSPEALVFYAEHGCWPEDENAADTSEFIGGERPA